MCKHWLDHSDYEDFGFCVRYPPQIIPESYKCPEGLNEYNSQYPQIYKSSFTCGEFELDPKQVDYPFTEKRV